MRQIHIREVGPRDGLQNARQQMPTEAKKAWVKAIAEAGVPEIEVGSFVPPKLIPAMADTAEITAFALTIPNLQVVVLAPNLKGFERALAAGAEGSFTLIRGGVHGLALRSPQGRLVPLPRASTWTRLVAAQLGDFAG